MALATNTTNGSIVLGGDLTGTAYSPELRPSGVVPGQYKPANIIVDSKGRIVWAKQAAYVEDILPLVPEASYTTKGICMVYETIGECDPQLLLENGEVRLNMRDATTEKLGKVTVDAVNSYLEIVSNALMKVKYATISSKGIMQAGSGLTVDNGVLELDVNAVASGEKGIIQIENGGGINITAGVISYAYGNATDTNNGIASFGSGLSVNNGHVTLNAPTATTSVKGLVQIGDNIDVSGGVISIADATDTVKGLVQIGSGLGASNGVLSLLEATYTDKGLVQIGDGIAVNAGVISVADASKTNRGICKPEVGGIINIVDGEISVPNATTSTLGVASFGAGLSVVDGHVTLNAPDATNTTKGIVQLGQNCVTTTPGELSVVPEGIRTGGSGATATGVPENITKAQWNGIVQQTYSPVIWTPQTHSSVLDIDVGGPVFISYDFAIPGTYFHIIIRGDHELGYDPAFKFKAGACRQPIGSVSLLSCFVVDAATINCIMQPNFV